MLTCLLAAAALAQGQAKDVFLPSVSIHRVLLNKHYPVHTARPPQEGRAELHPGYPSAKRDHALRGTLLDPDGEPMAGVVVGALSLGPGGLPLGLVALQRKGLGYQYGERSPMRSLGFTDEEGRFKIEGLWPGPHQVYAVDADQNADRVLPLHPPVATTGAEPIATTRHRLVGTFPGADRLGWKPEGPEMNAGRKPMEGHGRVRILLREPEGTLYSAISAIDLRRYTPAESGRGLVLGDPIRTFCIDPVIQLDLEPGRYRAVIRNEEMMPRCGVDFVPMVPWLRPAECTFEVHAHRVNCLTATFVEAGCVRIAFTDLPGAKPPISPPIDPDAEDACGRTHAALKSPITPRLVRVFYEQHPGGTKQPLHQRLTACPDWIRTSELYLPNAQAVTADPLAPGRYRLTFEVEGATIDPCWIDVAHGLVTDVDRALKSSSR